MKAEVMNQVQEEERFSTYYNRHEEVLVSQRTGLDGARNVCDDEFIVPEIMDYGDLWQSFEDMGYEPQSQQSSVSRREEIEKEVFEWQNQLINMEEAAFITQIIPVAEKTSREVCDILASTSNTAILDYFTPFKEDTAENYEICVIGDYEEIHNTDYLKENPLTDVSKIEVPTTEATDFEDPLIESIERQSSDTHMQRSTETVQLDNFEDMNVDDVSMVLKASYVLDSGVKLEDPLADSPTFIDNSSAEIVPKTTSAAIHPFQSKITLPQFININTEQQTTQLSKSLGEHLQIKSEKCVAKQTTKLSKPLGQHVKIKTENTSGKTNQFKKKCHTEHSSLLKKKTASKGTMPVLEDNLPGSMKIKKESVENGMICIEREESSKEIAKMKRPKGTKVIKEDNISKVNDCKSKKCTSKEDLRIKMFIKENKECPSKQSLLVKNQSLMQQNFKIKKETPLQNRKSSLLIENKKVPKLTLSKQKTPTNNLICSLKHNDSNVHFLRGGSPEKEVGKLPNSNKCQNKISLLPYFLFSPPKENKNKSLHNTKAKAVRRKIFPAEKRKEININTSVQVKMKEDEPSLMKASEEKAVVDVETVEEEAAPLLMAGDLSSLLEQFEAAEKVNCQELATPPALSSLSTQTIRDALPPKVMDRVKTSCKTHKKSITLIPALPQKQPGKSASRIQATGKSATTIQDAGKSASGVQDTGAELPICKRLKMMSGNGELVQFDHDYCTNDSSPVESSSHINISHGSENPGEAGTGNEETVLNSVVQPNCHNTLTECGVMAGSGSEQDNNEQVVSNKSTEINCDSLSAKCDYESVPLPLDSVINLDDVNTRKRKLNLEEYRVRREERDKVRSQDNSRANSPLSSSCGDSKEKPMVQSVEEVQTMTWELIDLTYSPVKSHGRHRQDNRNDLGGKSYHSQHTSSSASSFSSVANDGRRTQHTSSSASSSSNVANDGRRTQHTNSSASSSSNVANDGRRTRHTSSSASSTSSLANDHRRTQRKTNTSHKSERQRRSSASRMWSRSPSRSPSSHPHSRHRSRSRSQDRREHYRGQSPRRTNYHVNKNRNRNYRDKYDRSSRRYHSPPRQMMRNNPVNKERDRQMQERKVVYVGRILKGTTKADLRARFHQFGPITDISLHFREGADNYGFVTFEHKDDAYKAIEHGNNDPNLPRYDLCFGGRRAFCKQVYADLDGLATRANDQYGSPPPQPRANVSFENLLHNFKSQLSKRVST